MKDENDLALAQRLSAAKQSLITQIGKVVVGQNNTIEEVLVALFSRGHCLLQGVPGLAKTLLVTSLARVLDLKSSRIQFTPDLMPSDVTGTEILQEDPATKARMLRFVPGPIFANFILADEINRTPPKTQSAMLQAMQEGQITVGSQTLTLPKPFFVMATQNPIEQEGTYSLPEAQLDRFFLQSLLDYPTEAEEHRIAADFSGGALDTLTPVIGPGEVTTLQDLVRRVPVPDEVSALAVQLVRSTRPRDPSCPQAVKAWISWGASPRASQALVLAAKARALLDGRTAVDKEDVLRMAYPVLRHRIVLNYQADAESVRADDLIERLINTRQ